MTIEVKLQDGRIAYRKEFTLDNKDYAEFLNLPPEPDYAMFFWKDVGKRLGFDSTLIEIVQQKGQKTFWRGMQYVEGSRRRKFTALTLEK